jgi:hypothetical protein
MVPRSHPSAGRAAAWWRPTQGTERPKWVVPRRPGIGAQGQHCVAERTAKPATPGMDRIGAAGRRPLSGQGRPGAAADRRRLQRSPQVSARKEQRRYASAPPSRRRRTHRAARSGFARSLAVVMAAHQQAPSRSLHAAALVPRTARSVDASRCCIEQTGDVCGIQLHLGGSHAAVRRENSADGLPRPGPDANPTGGVTTLWNDGAGIYVATLVVNDGVLSSAAATGTITAQERRSSHRFVCSGYRR